jgi:hypothetical protein
MVCAIASTMVSTGVHGDAVLQAPAVAGTKQIKHLGIELPMKRVAVALSSLLRARSQE